MSTTVSKTEHIEPPSRCPVCGASLRNEPRGGLHCPSCGPLIRATHEPDAAGTDADADATPARDLGIFASSEPQALDRLIADATTLGGGLLVLDFRGVSFLPSAALGQLVELRKRVHLAKGRIALRSVHRDLREIFRITKLDGLFDLGA